MGNKGSSAKIDREIAKEFGGRKALSNEIQPKQLIKLYKRLVELYPFVDGVRESVCVADLTQQDSPLVFVNEGFEKMTGYPRELCIGRNCRFLQGKYTDKKTVQKIRDIIKGGRQGEVDILNYRRDGSAFFNSFILLPVRMSKKRSAKVTYFVAVQKDVTHLKLDATSPMQWTPVEVALVMDRYGLGQYGHNLIEENITGRRLFLHTEKVIEKLKIDFDDDKDELRQLVNELREDMSGSMSQVSGSDTFNTGEYWAPPDPLSDGRGSSGTLRATGSQDGSRQRWPKGAKPSGESASNIYSSVFASGLLKPGADKHLQGADAEALDDVASMEIEEAEAELRVPSIAKHWRRHTEDGNNTLRGGGVAGAGNSAKKSGKKSGKKSKSKSKTEAAAAYGEDEDSELDLDQEFVTVKLFLGNNNAAITANTTEIIRMPRSAPLKSLMKRVRRQLDLPRVRLIWRCPTANGGFVPSDLASDTAYRMAKAAVGNSIMNVTVDADDNQGVTSEDETNVIDSFFAPMLIADQNGQVVKGNSAAVAQLGFSAAELQDASLGFTQIFPQVNFLNRRNRTVYTDVNTADPGQNLQCLLTLQFNQKQTTAVVTLLTKTLLEKMGKPVEKRTRAVNEGERRKSSFDYVSSGGRGRSGSILKGTKTSSHSKERKRSDDVSGKSSSQRSGRSSRTPRSLRSSKQKPVTLAGGSLRSSKQAHGGGGGGVLSPAGTSLQRIDSVSNDSQMIYDRLPDELKTSEASRGTVGGAAAGEGADGVAKNDSGGSVDSGEVQTKDDILKNLFRREAEQDDLRQSKKDKKHKKDKKKHHSSSTSGRHRDEAAPALPSDPGDRRSAMLKPSIGAAPSQYK